MSHFFQHFVTAVIKVAGTPWQMCEDSTLIWSIPRAYTGQQLYRPLVAGYLSFPNYKTDTIMALLT